MCGTMKETVKEVPDFAPGLAKDLPPRGMVWCRPSCERILDALTVMPLALPARGLRPVCSASPSGR
jgi:hypothetical protein